MDLFQFSALLKDPVTLTLVILISVFLVAFSLLVLRFFLKKISSGRSAADSEPNFASIGRFRGKLEKLEQTLNSFRTEVLRNYSMSNAELSSVKKELLEIKNLLNQKMVVQPEQPGSESSERTVYSGSEALRRNAVSEFPGKGSVAPEKQIERDDTLESAFPEVSRKNLASPARSVQEEVINSIARKKNEPEPEKREYSADADHAPESLKMRLQKTRNGILGKIRKVFVSGPVLNEGMLEDLEAHLVFADLGIKTVAPLMEELKQSVQDGRNVDEHYLQDVLKKRIVSILSDGGANLPVTPHKQGDGPMVILMIGVNGSGKTTTAAKLAGLWKDQGLKVMMVAADTFRAAAVEQLCHWGEELNIPVVKGDEDVRPSTVVFDAMERARREDMDALIIDTAGRLHTKSNLMQELEGIFKVIKKHQPDAPHETILVIDGSTGQNALNQAREFHSSVPITGLVITKLDGTPRGGIVVAIKNELGIPVRYIGVGESKDDLRPFVVSDFVEAIFDSGQSNGSQRIAENSAGKKGLDAISPIPNR